MACCVLRDRGQACERAATARRTGSSDKLLCPRIRHWHGANHGIARQGLGSPRDRHHHHVAQRCIGIQRLCFYMGPMTSPWMSHPCRDTYFSMNKTPRRPRFRSGSCHDDQ